MIQIKNNVSNPPGIILVKLGIHPTTINIVGLLAGLAAAFFVGFGNLFWGALTFLFSGLADALDGTVARLRREENDFGVFFDSVCDRYVDTAMFLGISWYFMQQQMPLYIFLSFMGLIGTVVTSYSSARAESLSLTSRYIGFMNRPERAILMFIGLVFPVS